MNCGTFAPRIQKDLIDILASRDYGAFVLCEFTNFTTIFVTTTWSRLTFIHFIQGTFQTLKSNRLLYCCVLVIRSHYESLREIIHVGKMEFPSYSRSTWKIPEKYCFVNAYHPHLHTGNLECPLSVHLFSDTVNKNDFIIFIDLYVAQNCKMNLCSCVRSWRKPGLMLTHYLNWPLQSRNQRNECRTKDTRKTRRIDLMIFIAANYALFVNRGWASEIKMLLKS